MPVLASIAHCTAFDFKITTKTQETNKKNPTKVYGDKNHLCFIGLGFCFFMVKKKSKNHLAQIAQVCLIDTKLFMQYRNFWGLTQRQLNVFSRKSVPGIFFT